MVCQVRVDQRKSVHHLKTRAPFFLSVKLKTLLTPSFSQSDTLKQRAAFISESDNLNYYGRLRYQCIKMTRSHSDSSYFQALMQLRLIFSAHFLLRDSDSITAPAILRSYFFQLRDIKTRVGGPTHLANPFTPLSSSWESSEQIFAQHPLHFPSRLAIFPRRITDCCGRIPSKMCAFWDSVCTPVICLLHWFAAVIILFSARCTQASAFAFKLDAFGHLMEAIW